ncbi:MAG: hybrid sensor histidine kinase/response regulator [Panacagrimonas sp.]|nr:GAF domain-containing protein [Panacagrimonas sp.]MCC2657076.1 hybrid sensor histidine kinase/response regulator [Panacagrimonas sp.]
MPLAAIIVAVFALYARREAQQSIDQLIEREQSRLRMAELRLSEVMAENTVDLRVIAAAPSVRWFVGGDESALRLIAMLFSTFVAEDWSYEALTLVDAHGRERVSVVRTAEGPRTLGDDELETQDDALVTRTLRLLPRQLEVARFALDVDRGRVALPYKPVLRMATRVSAGAGRPDYVIVAKLRGAVLLKGLRDLIAYGDGEIWLLDEDGYWILHPDPRFNWGAQLDPTHRLATQMPALAEHLHARSGDVALDESLYVHRHIEPLASRAGDGLIATPPSFDLVARTPPERMPPAWPVELAMAMTVVLLLAAAGCAILARLRVRSELAERRERRLLEESASTNELRSWIKEHIYQLSLEVHAARDPEGFGAATLAKLAPTLHLAAACAYALQEGRAQPIAGFALSADFQLREFAPGEGLVGEALRSRQDVRLCPPPAGYLDLSGGAGDGAPAEIRILPLWVHGHTVGVLELAFSRLLEPREEEFLRQALPLLAINLEGLLERRIAPVA